MKLTSILFKILFKANYTLFSAIILAITSFFFIKVFINRWTDILGTHECYKIVIPKYIVVPVGCASDSFPQNQFLLLFPYLYAVLNCMPLHTLWERKKILVKNIIYIFLFFTDFFDVWSRSINDNRIICVSLKKWGSTGAWSQSSSYTECTKMLP